MFNAFSDIFNRLAFVILKGFALSNIKNARLDGDGWSISEEHQQLGNQYSFSGFRIKGPALSYLVYVKKVNGKDVYMGFSVGEDTEEFGVLGFKDFRWAIKTIKSEMANKVFSGA